MAATARYNELSKRATSSGTYSTAIAHADNYTRWVLDLFAPHIGESTLEVGLGHGTFRAHLPAHTHYTGVDIDHDAVRCQQVAYANDEYFQSDIATPVFVQDAMQRGPYDSVLCTNVLEHVLDDALAVSNLLAVLKPMGRLFVYVPAHPRLYGTMDRLAGHHRRYRRRDLIALAGRNPVLDCAYVNPVGALGWLMNRNVRYDTLDAGVINRQIALFDRYVLPISRLLTPATSAIFGLSVYCVIEKPC